MSCVIFLIYVHDLTIESQILATIGSYLLMAIPCTAIYWFLFIQDAYFMRFLSGACMTHYCINYII